MNALLMDVLMEHGVWATLFIGSLIVFHLWIANLHKGRLDDRQREIDRLAEDNRNYRDVFLRLLGDKMSIKGE